MCQGFGHFLDFLHHFVLVKLATSSIRVKHVSGRTNNYGVIKNVTDLVLLLVQVCFW